eukprot:gene7035-2847_t
MPVAAAALLFAASSRAAAPPVGCPGDAAGADAVLWKGDGVVALRNGYACIVISSTRPSVVALYGDYEGRGNFSGSMNVLASQGLVLETEEKAVVSKKIVSHSSAAGPAAAVRVTAVGGALAGVAPD